MSATKHAVQAETPAEPQPQFAWLVVAPGKPRTYLTFSNNFTMEIAKARHFISEDEGRDRLGKRKGKVALYLLGPDKVPVREVQWREVHP